MTKKKSSSGSVNSVRREIQRVDRDLLKLLGDRARAAQKLAKIRQSDGTALYDLAEEQQGLTELVTQNKGPLGETAVRSIYREILGAARSLVKPIRVAYLGPRYSYSHLAAIDRFGDGPDLTPVATIKAVFESLHFHQTDYGIVPIENSTDGRIVDTLDMFARLPTRITSEVELAIHHHLLGKCSRGEVVEVYSKPQAISQCREWMEAGTHYGLTVIDGNIEDNKNNVTRFAVIGGEMAHRTGRDKTALMFEIPHKPGSLADAMLVFKRGRLNLTWIESFPMPGSKNEYLFFVELEGHQTDSRVKRALEALRRKTARLEVLGSYPRAAASA